MTETSPTPSPRRVVQARILRALGVAIIVALVIWQRQRLVIAGRILAEGDPTLWLLAAAMQFACIFVAAIRLSLLVRAVDHRIPLPTLFFDLVCTTALNAALLMGVGDLYRIKRTNQFIGNVALSSAIIVLDRILGFAVICGVALVSMALMGASGFEFHPSYVLILLAILILGALVLRIIASRSQMTIWFDLKRPFVAVLHQPGIGFGAKPKVAYFFDFCTGVDSFDRDNVDSFDRDQAPKDRRGVFRSMGLYF